MRTKILLFLCLLSVFSFSKNPTYSKIEVSLEGGLNRFDGDINQKLTDLFPNSVWGLTGGANVEYKFTPVVGLFVNYYYIPMRAKTRVTGTMVNIETNIHTASINSSIDFTHLFLPYSQSKITFNGSIGLGYSHYMFNVNPKITYISDNYGEAITVPVSFYLKYNYSRHVDLGIKIAYISFNKDNLEGVWGYKGVTNDYEGIGTLFAVYKLNPTEYPLRDNNLTIEINRINNSLSDLDKRVYNQNVRIDSLSAYNLNKQENICCKDGTINEIPSIYFDFDKYKLDDWALITISKVAERLKLNPNLKVEIRGYCDWMGNSPYNFKLSDRRVIITKRELVNTWGISPDRITIFGKGKLYDPKMRYKANRRCDFLFN